MISGALKVKVPNLGICIPLPHSHLTGYVQTYIKKSLGLVFFIYLESKLHEINIIYRIRSKFYQ